MVVLLQDLDCNFFKHWSSFASLYKMPLLASGCEIPGISAEKFEAQWSQYASETLQVDQSPLGGIGLFYTPQAHQDTDPVVLRVPVAKTYNLETCMEILDLLKETGEKDYKIILGLLSAAQPETETLILVCYVVALVYISNCGDSVPEKVRQVIDEHAAYLEVLKSTFTISYPTIGTGSDPVINTLIRNAQLLKQLYEQITLESDLDPKYMPFEQFYQLLQAVSSRVLEVPEEIEKDGDDFYVTPTLVPLLDFANHSFTPNAYFDLDRNTNCVLLKLHKDKIPQTGRFEVTISYNSDRQIGPFLSTYGFVPQVDLRAAEGISVALPTSLWSPEHNLKRKWLGVPSKVQVIPNEKGNCSLQYPELLALVFDKDVHLNPKWPDYLTKLLQDDYLPEDIALIIEDIKKSEISAEIVQTNGNICGLMYGDDGEVMTMEMAYEIYSNKSPAQLAQLESACNLEIIAGIKKYAAQIDKEMSEKAPDASSFDSLVYQYHKTMKTVLDLVLQSVKL